MRATGAESGSETGEEENQPAIPHIEFMKTRVEGGRGERERER